MSEQKTVELFTDGACSGNPGPGGWGTLLRYGAHTLELSGGYRLTTNNRMEILAVIRGLERLKEPCRVELYSDSKYVVDAVNQGWVYGWKKNNWLKSNKDPALNVDLWEQLLPLLARHTVTLHWVKGHDGHPENERCDVLATTAAAAEGLPEDIGYTQD
ncbi:MAG: ribonuclease HI [Ruminococcaceae bacterium]|nr:ribonuclease HI [Oscillospiraceae bacterium]